MNQFCVWEDIMKSVVQYNLKDFSIKLHLLNYSLFYFDPGIRQIWVWILAPPSICDLDQVYLIPEFWFFPCKTDTRGELALRLQTWVFPCGDLVFWVHLCCRSQALLGSFVCVPATGAAAANIHLNYRWIYIYTPIPTRILEMRSRDLIRDSWSNPTSSIN